MTQFRVNLASIYSMVFPLMSEKVTKDSWHKSTTFAETPDGGDSKLLLDRVDLMCYKNPDLFDLGPLTHYFLRDKEEELFAEAVLQLPKVEAEIDKFFSQAAVIVEQMTGRLSSVASKILESSVSVCSYH